VEFAGFEELESVDARGTNIRYGRPTESAGGDTYRPGDRIVASRTKRTKFGFTRIAGENGNLIAAKVKKRLE